MKQSFILLFIIAITTQVFAQTDYNFTVQTTIKNGVIEGNFDTQTGIHKYFGIPFAQPPVGDLRWKAPVPIENWDGVKETKSFGPRPVQKIVFGDMNSRSDGLSEDCLYLNVWTPAKRDTKGLPVLLYYYGGGNAAGDASEPRYDGESMAQKGIVVVTANYRLNIFGFLAHPQLTSESPYGASGNYGMLDQSAALQWVKDNIAAFGGDPDKITIAGESAGSIAVSMQMSSPLSRDNIAGAIGESGAGISPTMAPVTLAEAENMGEAFVKNNGFDSFEEFRNLSTYEIYEIFNDSGMFGFPIVIDGHFLPKTLPEIFEAGEQAQVPLLLGWNSAEIPGFAFTQGPYTEEVFVQKVKEAFPEHHEKVLELYPHGNPEELAWAATNLASDRFIVYSTWKWFDLHRKNSTQPVYRYLYSKLRPPLKDSDKVSGFAGGTADAEGPQLPPAIGAPHACEIEYCMGNLHLVEEYAWTEEDFKVSQTMQEYFANFIKTGNPNSESLAEWPSAAADDTTPPVMIIDVESKAVESTVDARYELLDEYYGNN